MKVSVPFLKAFSTGFPLLSRRRRATLPSRCPSLRSSLPDPYPAPATPHLTTLAPQLSSGATRTYFNQILTEKYCFCVESLPCSAVYSWWGSCTWGPLLSVRVFPSQPRESCQLEGSSSSVGGGTHSQRVRAAHASAFVSITQHHVSDKKVECLSNPRWAKPAGSRKKQTLLFNSSRTASALPQRARCWG